MKDLLKDVVRVNSTQEECECPFWFIPEMNVAHTPHREAKGFNYRNKLTVSSIIGFRTTQNVGAPVEIEAPRRLDAKILANTGF